MLNKANNSLKTETQSIVSEHHQNVAYNNNQQQCCMNQMEQQRQTKTPQNRTKNLLTLTKHSNCNSNTNHDNNNNSKNNTHIQLHKQQEITSSIDRDNVDGSVESFLLCPHIYHNMMMTMEYMKMRPDQYTVSLI